MYFAMSMMFVMGAPTLNTIVCNFSSLHFKNDIEAK